MEADLSYIDLKKSRGSKQTKENLFSDVKFSLTGINIKHDTEENSGELEDTMSYAKSNRGRGRGRGMEHTRRPNTCSCGVPGERRKGSYRKTKTGS